MGPQTADLRTAAPSAGPSAPRIDEVAPFGVGELPGITVLGELGRGGQSIVYRIRRDGVEFAMKVLLDAVDDDREQRALFRREAALLTMAGHPGLAGVHDVGEVDGRPYLIMDLIHGTELTSALRAGRMPEDQIIELAAELVDVLASIHRVGLVHRDIKPSNILLQPDGTARLIDLGMAGRAAPEIVDLVAGTLTYASPEQVGTLKRPVDRRSDLYSLGVVLFECAAGTAPFASADVGELLRMHACEAPPDLLDLRPDFSPGLATVIGSLLAKDPDDRYPDCASLAADLRTLAADRHAIIRSEQHGGSRPTVIALPWVGRHDELADLHEQWAAARHGTGRLVVVNGGPGSGKSRFLAHFANDPIAAGTPVLHGACLAGAPPLAPLAEAVERYVAHISANDDESGAVAVERLRAAAGVAAPYLRRLTPALASLLDDGADVSDSHTDSFVQIVATFLTELAVAAGGAILMIDDVDQLDGATARVLQQVMVALSGAPLLLVVATGDDTADEAGRFVPAVAVDLRIALGPLHHDVLAELVTPLAGRLRLDADLLERIVSRAGGTPLGAIEYFGAVLDAGLIVPRWGAWVLDAHGLDTIDLPTDTLSLLVRRIDELGPPSRRLLTAAAAIGMSFAAELAARVGVLDTDEAGALFDAAIEHGVLERRDGGLAFIHDRVRRALLDTVAEDQLRELHHRIAELLHTAEPPATAAEEATRCYALARHFMAGYPQRDPSAVYAACIAAGRRALTDHAAAEAVGFFEFARSLAIRQSPTAHSGLQEDLGTAYHLNAQFNDAEEALGEASRTASDPVTRARILEQRARVHLATWRLDAAMSTARAGLAELGRSLPTNSIWLAVTTIYMIIAYLFVRYTRIGFGITDPARLAQYRLVASLYTAAGHASVRMLRPGLMVLLNLRRRYVVARIGMSLELVYSVANSACINALVTTRPNRRGFAAAARLAAEFGNPEGIAYAQYVQGVVDVMTNPPDAAAHLRWLKKHEALLDTGHCLDYRHSLCNRLLLSGRTDEALAVYEQGVVCPTGTDLSAHPYAQLGLAVSAAMGRTVDARKALSPLDERIAAFGSRGSRVNLLASCALIAVEQGERDEAFDRIASEFETLRVNSVLLIPTLRTIYATLAYGRLDQCRHATDADRDQALLAATRALRALKVAALGGGIGADLMIHYRVIRAHLHHVQGQPDKAWEQLTIADRLLRNRDIPLASFEAARVRARLLIARGRPDTAVAQISGAIALAERFNWPHRAEWIRAEFKVSVTSRPSTTATMRTNAGQPGTDRRRLAALERLSATASRILDPDELTRVALDETIHILAAERAYLFLTHADEGDAADAPGRLLPHVGRDAAGNDLDIMTDYGSTVVRRVQQSREAVVVTGTEDGIALGSQSVIAHGLRSIMAAPLQFDGRLLGVVYLDSRVAKGMFTGADVGILTAITNHIAAALETARAAQLAVDVRAAEQQRDVADRLREATVYISGSLDPADVLDRLHRTLARNLPSDSSCLVRCHPDGLRLIRGTDGDATEEPVIAGADLNRILIATAPTTGAGGNAELSGLLGLPAPGSAAARSWLGIPLRHRDHLIGAMILSVGADDAYGAPETHFAAAMTGEGLLAFDNAQLFAQVEAMATTDGLTGISNRRHFLTLAERDATRTRDRSGRMTAVMADIDHFKKINDGYGHHVGDQVIQAVAQRLRQGLRPADQLGRYGGEEFAAFLVDDGEQPLLLGERLRTAIGEVPVDTDAGPLRVTISVGLHVFDPALGTLAEALNRADTALYRSKQDGRNRVTLAEPDRAPAR